MVESGLLPGCDLIPFIVAPMNSPTPFERCIKIGPPSASIIMPAWMAAMHTEVDREYNLVI